MAVAVLAWSITNLHDWLGQNWTGWVKCGPTQQNNIDPLQVAVEGRMSTTLEEPWDICIMPAQHEKNGTYLLCDAANGTWESLKLLCRSDNLCLVSWSSASLLGMISSDQWSSISSLLSAVNRGPHSQNSEEVARTCPCQRLLAKKDKPNSVPTLHSLQLFKIIATISWMCLKSSACW